MRAFLSFWRCRTFDNPTFHLLAVADLSCSLLPFVASVFLGSILLPFFSSVIGAATLLRFEVVYEHCTTLMVACWVLVLLQVRYDKASIKSIVCAHMIPGTRISIQPCVRGENVLVASAYLIFVARAAFTLTFLCHPSSFHFTFFCLYSSCEQALIVTLMGDNLRVARVSAENYDIRRRGLRRDLLASDDRGA